MAKRKEILDRLIANLFDDMPPAAKVVVATRITEAVKRGLSPEEFLAELAQEHPEMTRRGIEAALEVWRDLEGGS